jgi:hypothetical protein
VAPSDDHRVVPLRHRFPLSRSLTADQPRLRRGSRVRTF